MRLSELLGRRVVSSEGAELGHVHDVLLVQDGPTAGVAGAQFRVHGLAVGRRAVGTRLGVVDGHVERPRWLRVLGRRGRLVPWHAITEIGPDRITVDADALLTLEESS